MPRRPSVPAYTLHKPTGQAYVRLPQPGGKRPVVYLGPYGSAESREKYHRVVSEYLAARDAAIAGDVKPRRELSLAEVMVHYQRWATQHYTKSGRQTSELTCIKSALRRLREGYGRTQAKEFGPRALKSLRQSMITDGLARGTINKDVGRIRRMFRWAASEELVDASVWHALQTVSGLQRGRTSARETEPIKPIDDAIVEATCQRLSPKVASMVRLQRLLGCRPHEVCDLRIGDVDRSREVWLIIPGSHKTEHHGRERIIAVGPKSQEILAPWLLGPDDRFAFESRKGRCYTHSSYRRAIERACERAGVEQWAPNRLRHNRATELRRDFGLDVAGAVLGHAGLAVTQIYAEKNLNAAIEAARKTG